LGVARAEWVVARRGWPGLVLELLGALAMAGRRDDRLWPGRVLPRSWLAARMWLAEVACGHGLMSGRLVLVDSKFGLPRCTLCGLPQVGESR
jgi:hypothetical protein